MCIYIYVYNSILGTMTKIDKWSHRPCPKPSVAAGRNPHHIASHGTSPPRHYQGRLEQEQASHAGEML